MIRSYGTQYIKDFLKKYKMSFEVINEREKYDIREIKKFIEKLNKICDEYVCKHNYNIIKNQNKELEEKIKRYNEDISVIITEKAKEEIDLYKNRYETRENIIKKNYELIMNDLKKEIEKQKAINEKWKAMFTEQAMANAKLVNKEEN